MVDLKYIAAGTGRSGSVYMAKLMTSLGLPCGHESIFTPKGFKKAHYLLKNPEKIKMSEISLKDGAWMEPEDIVAESSYMAAPFLHFEELQDCKIIHVTRHPLLVINSFIFALKFFQSHKPENEWEKFIYKHVPEMAVRMDSFQRAAVFYVRWNQIIERNIPDFTYRLGDDLQPLFRFLDADPDPGDYFNKRSNSLMTSDGSVDFIPESPIKRELEEMCERYGYPFPLKCKKMFI